LPESADAYGSSAPPPREDDEPPPRIVCPTIFKGRTPPPRRWIVHQWIPYGVVTGLYGDGGIGKSLMAQQLQTATDLGAAWLGLPVEEAASLGVYCEDDKNELWRRQCEMDGQNRPVSSSARSGNYAPREFEKLPNEQRQGFKKADFQKAMNALFRDRKINNVPYGRKGDERFKIADCGDDEAR
jgi:hypothetical protein